MQRPKFLGKQGHPEMEGCDMSVIRKGYAVSAFGFLPALFSALLALALLDPRAGSAQEVKEIRLTETHLQGFMSASPDMEKLSYATSPDNSDSALEAQTEALVRKNGFASVAEFDEVAMNIAMIMSGIDQQTKKFTEPPDQIKQQIAALKADKSVPEPQKKENLAELEAALKDSKPIQFKENIVLVQKYFDKLAELMQEHGPSD
jgi:hypothetical protein